MGEIEEDDQRKLIGVGRLVADPDHDTAEFAVEIHPEPVLVVEKGRDAQRDTAERVV